MKKIERKLHSFSLSGSLIPYYQMMKNFYKKYVDYKSPVGSWAVQNLDYTDRLIDKEKLREEKN